MVNGLSQERQCLSGISLARRDASKVVNGSSGRRVIRPRTRRLMASSSRSNLSASGRRPSADRTIARFPIVFRVSGWSGPSTLRWRSSVSRSNFSASAYCASQDRTNPRLLIDFSVSKCSGPSTRRRRSSVSRFNFSASGKRRSAIRSTAAQGPLRGKIVRDTHCRAVVSAA